MTNAPERTPATQNQDAYDNLLTAIETSEGQLSLLIAVCDDPQLREEIIARYERELAPQVKSYRLALAKDEPSLRAAIYRAVESNDYLKRGGRAVLTLTGAEQLYFLSQGDKPSEQDKFFGYLQWTREALRDFRFPVVLWVTYQLLNNLSRKAPDFWSWRKGVFRFASHKTLAVAARELEPFRSVGLELPSLDDDALLPLEDMKALLDKVEQDNPNDPLVGNLYSQLGRIYAERLKRGEALDYGAELNQAVEYFQAAIAQQEKHKQLLDLARSLGWLGSLYYSMGRYSEAESLYVRSLAIYEAQLGKDHPDTATSLNNLAELYRSMGRYSEAESLYHRALSILLSRLGQDHPNSQTVMQSFVELLREAVQAGRAGELSDHPLTQELLAQLQAEHSPD